MEGKSFYCSGSTSGYLTPLQRKKLREMRNFDLPSFDIKTTPEEKRAKPKKIPKQLEKNMKAKKLTSKNNLALASKKKKGEKLDLVHLVINSKHSPGTDTTNDVKTKRKIFTSRSPDHVAKSNFKMSLIWKKNLNLSLKPFPKASKKLSSGDRKITLSKSSRSKKPFEDISPEQLFPTPPNETKINISSENVGETSVCSSRRLFYSPLKNNKDKENVSYLSSDDDGKSEKYSSVEVTKDTFENKVLCPLILDSSESSLNISDNTTAMDNLADECDKESTVKSSEVSSEDIVDQSLDDITLFQELEPQVIDSEEMQSDSCDSVLAGHIVNKSGDSYILAPKKLYPIFDSKLRRKEITSLKRQNANSSPLSKRNKTKGDQTDQYIIDAGQKEIGAKVCNTCNMVYNLDDKSDTDLHLRHHNLYIDGLKFAGWSKERVIGEFHDGRVIMIRKEDKNFMMRKVEDVLVIVNRQLGFPTGGLPTRPNPAFLFFVSSEKRIVGCLVAEQINAASRVILDTSSTNIVPCRPEENKSVDKSCQSWCSSSSMVPALCGVSRIWVSSESRRCGIASRMLDCLRCHFIYAHPIDFNELAFSDPSLDGREFAAAYTGTDNFLVYK